VGAIYDITPCSEETVNAILETIEPAPIQQYELNRIKLLKAPEPAPITFENTESPDQEEGEEVDIHEGDSI
jgi:hypothetical protein